MTSKFSLLRGHKLCRCYKEDCYVCSRELDYCLVCGAGEGELTTECCGKKLTPYAKEQCYEWNYNYCVGRWVNQEGKVIPEEFLVDWYVK